MWTLNISLYQQLFEFPLPYPSALTIIILKIILDQSVL